MLPKMSSQTIQSMFWNFGLKQYMETVAEMSGNVFYIDEYYRLLKYTALRNGVYDFAGLEDDPPKPNGSIKLGTMVLAARDMITMQSYRGMEDISEEITYTGRRIIEQLVLYPLGILYAVGHEDDLIL